MAFLALDRARISLLVSVLGKTQSSQTFCSSSELAWFLSPALAIR